MNRLLDELKSLVASSNLFAANKIFFSYLDNRSLMDITSGDVLEAAAYFLETILPLTLHEYPSLILTNRALTDKYKLILGEAWSLGFAPEHIRRQKLRLGCLEAISVLMRGEKDEIVIGAEENGFGPLHLGVMQHPEWESCSYEEVERFFREYFKKAKEKDDDNLIKEVSKVVFDVLSRLKEEETVPGIARGLFVDALTGTGDVRRVLVRIEEGDGSIEYAALSGEEISDSLRAAAQNAWLAANAYLLEKGYLEGLEERKVTWQITDLDVTADTLKTFYDGASMGFPLVMAIISAYLKRPIPSTVGFTGAFDITSAKKGILVKVGGIGSKCRAAIKNGIRFIFLPKGNEMDIDLSLQKQREREDFSLSFVDTISEACDKIFGESRKRSGTAFIKDILETFWSVLTLRPENLFLKENLKHIWASAALLVLVYIFEGIMLYRIVPATPLPVGYFFAMMIPSCAIMCGALLLCYAIAPVFLEHQREDSWYVSFAILAVAETLVYILMFQLTKGETPDLSKFPDWPEYIGLFKDLFIFFSFTVLYATNLFNYIATLNYLADRYQIITVRKSLEGRNILDTRIPVRVLSIPWNWALLGLLICGSLLMTFEIITFWSFREGLETTKLCIALCILRDISFLVLAAEVIIWYRNSLGTLAKRVRDF